MAMNVKEWINEKEFAFHRIETLVVLLISAGVLLMQVVIPFIRSYTINPIIHVVIIVLTYGLIILYWYYNRSVFPKCKKSKQQIVIAIITENAKQKTRITNDFAKQIKRQLTEFGLDLSYDVIVLHNHQSRVFQNRINLFSQSLRAKLYNSEDVEKFNKLTKKLNAKFIIYGDLIKRNSENTTYCLSVEAMILHSPTDLHSGKSIHEEFQKLWKKEISFLEREELTGFKANANQIFFISYYMIGLTTFVDNNFIQGIKIWESLEVYIRNKHELEEYFNKVKTLKATAYLLQSRFLYFNGDIQQSMIYRKKYLELTPNDYDKFLMEAINQIKVRNDAEMALEFIRKAEKIAPKTEGTWRYSELYLLIRLRKCKEALESLDRIIEISFPNEIDTINQVISYNATCLKEDLSHIQTNFIIGVLIYKKLNLPIPAYEKLEAFINSNDENKEFELLKNRAKQYLEEIDKIIGVK